MKFIRLTFCILIFAFANDVSAQTKGEIKQNAEPSFFRSMSNYVRMNERRKIEGYRVQIFNGQRSTANEMRTKCLRLFPDMLSMVIFETPDYKLQVGNYRTLYEAEEALQAIRKEFPGAFIVETDIDPPALEEEE